MHRGLAKSTYILYFDITTILSKNISGVKKKLHCQAASLRVWNIWSMYQCNMFHKCSNCLLEIKKVVIIYTQEYILKRHMLNFIHLYIYTMFYVCYNLFIVLLCLIMFICFKLFSRRFQCCQAPFLASFRNCMDIHENFEQLYKSPFSSVTTTTIDWSL